MRTTSIVFLSLLVLGTGVDMFRGGRALAAETIVLEGESLVGEELTKGFERSVSYMAPGKGTATGTLHIAAKGRYQVYARAYFHWANSEHLLISVAGNELVAGTKERRPFRWDLTSAQVWHWIRAGEVQLSRGEHQVTVKGPGRLDRLVFYKGDQAWREDWLAGTQVHAAGEIYDPPKGDIVLSPSNWRTTGNGSLKTLADATVCLIQDPGDSALRRFSVRKDEEFEVWARLYFYNKNMFEGRTMQEMQHCTYVLIDGCLRGTVMEQSRRRWTWYKFGTVKLKKGEHLVSVAQRGGPVLVGEVVLKRSKDDADTRDWYRKPMNAVLPFGIPGGADPFLAKRAGHWLLLGPLGPDSSGKWLGEESGGKEQIVEVSLPKQSGRLVMEANKPLPCSAALESQVVGFYCKGDVDDLAFSVILIDGASRSWLAPCSTVKAGGGWYYCSYFLAPVAPAGAGLLPLGDSSRLPEPIGPANRSERPHLRLPCERQPMPAQWGTTELTHIVIDSPGGRRGSIRISEPVFGQPISVHASGKTDKDWARLTFRLSNNFTHPLDVELHAQVGPVGENISAAEKDRRWRRFVVSVPGGKNVESRVDLPLPRGGAYVVSYRVGLGDIRRLWLSAGKEAQPLLDSDLTEAMTKNCAYEDATWKRNIPAAEVSRRYGKGFTIAVDDLDITSVEYAERHNSIKPFRIVGSDLSDGVGWPEIHVAPGTVMYDPRLGRIKFAEGYDGPCMVVGSYPTGFGVPGGGAPSFFGDKYATIPGGEGNFSLFDLTRDDRPLPIGMVPSWYFEHDGHKLDNWLFFNSSHRGFTVIDDFSNPTRPGVLRRVAIDVEHWGRVRSIDEDLRLLLCDGGRDKGITIFSLDDPLRPKMEHAVTGCWSPIPTGDSGRYIVRIANGLALLDIRDRRGPKRTIEWTFPEGEDEWQKMRIMAVGSGRIACRLPDVMVEVAKRKQKRAAIVCLEFREKGPKKGFRQLAEQCTDLPAARSILAAFYKDYVYLLNGQAGSGQYGLGTRGPFSEWYTYRIAKGKLQQVGEKIVDEYPSAYSQVSVHGERAYVTEYNMGMWVFDLSDPAKPKKVGRYYSAAEGDALYVQNGVAYFWQTFGGQIYIIDCARPWKPVCSGVYWDGAWVSYQNRFRGSNTILGKDNVIYNPRTGKGITIIDVSNPTTPHEIGILEHPGANLRIRGDILATVGTETVTVGGKKQRTKVVRFYDLDDPRKPLTLGSVQTQAGSALYWKGSYLYLTEGTWLTIVDTSDPRKPIVVSETDLKATLPEFADASTYGIAVGDGVAYLTARAGEKHTALMVVVDVSDVRHPKPVRIFDSVTDYLDTECSESWANFYQDIIIRDKMLFVGCYGRIECFDVTKPLLPRLVEHKELGFQWSVGMLEGDYLYVPGLAEFILLKVPASPQRPLGRLEVK